MQCIGVHIEGFALHLDELLWRDEYGIVADAIGDRFDAVGKGELRGVSAARGVFDKVHGVGYAVGQYGDVEVVHAEDCAQGEVDESEREHEKKDPTRVSEDFAHYAA